MVLYPELLTSIWFKNFQLSVNFQPPGIGCIKPIHNKGDESLPSNYRGIILLEKLFTCYDVPRPLVVPILAQFNFAGDHPSAETVDLPIVSKYDRKVSTARIAIYSPFCCCK